MAWPDDASPSPAPDVVRLFPLPNFVMFPGVLQPLRVFEERYVEMFEATLKTDRHIAMVLLAPGFEKDYDGRPKIHDVCCLGRVITHTRLPDGTYNFLLQGVERMRILEELPPVRSYREARVQTLHDDSPPADEAEVTRAKLVECFREVWPATGEQQLKQLLDEGLSLGTLTDLLAFSVPIETPLKQRLLAQSVVMARANLLLNTMGVQSAYRPGPRPFPPGFSDN
jgi:ATP-dependent Lon protease